MKVDRRTFLAIGSFVVGGAAGTALSPLPWKLTDDLSIWTQMWPWTPVPEDGEIIQENSVCALCPGGCGIRVRKINGLHNTRAIKIEGMDEYPVNKGGICILGLSGLQLLYSPTRVKQPMKRCGNRGEGKWKEIPWEQAIAEIAEKLGELRAAGKPNTLGCIVGSKQGTMTDLFKHFLTAYGSPNLMTTPSAQDAYEITVKLMHGTDSRVGFDVEHSDFVLSFGAGILDGWGSPVRMFRANSSWKENGVKVVQAEPRLSNTAAKADRWLPIKPGTEAQLALAIANVLINEDLYNKDFVANHCDGFDLFKKIVTDGFSPEKVSEATGINAEVIQQIAQEFGQAEKPIAICGRGDGSTPGSFHEFMAVHALNALKGNLNAEGGVWALPRSEYADWQAPELDDIAKAGLENPRVDGAGTEAYPNACSLLNRLANVINAEEESPIQALLVSDANPCYTLPDSKNVNAAFSKIPFIVSFSSYMDETAMQADLILPNHHYLERLQDVPAPTGYPKPIVGLAKPIIAPQFNTMNTGDAIIQIAKAMEGSVAEAFSWDNYEACLAETFGENWEKLQEDGYLTDEEFQPTLEGAFATESGKLELLSVLCKAKDIAEGEAIPHVKQVALEGDESFFSLVLIPFDTMRISGSAIANTPFMTKTVEDTILKGNDILVEVNPRTADAIGVKEGSYAVLKTPKGEAKVKVHLSEGIGEKIIAIPRGLGHSTDDKYLAGKGVNINELIGPVEDPVSGLDAAWGIRANLTRA